MLKAPITSKLKHAIKLAIKLKIIAATTSSIFCSYNKMRLVVAAIIFSFIASFIACFILLVIGA